MTQRALRVSGGQVVYAELKQQILDLELAPGERLYEPDLAQKLQVSRTPLREAIKLLVAEGLLEQLPTGGVVVPPLAVRDIDELYTARAALEGIQAEAAARKASESDIAGLTEIVERNALLVGFADDAEAIGHSLHERIGVVADNSWVTRLHRQVDGHMSRYRKLTNYTQRRREQALREHQAIVAAIAQHQPDIAAKRASDHVFAAQAEAIRALEQRGLGPGLRSRD